ncbi:MAG: hypothetical protein C0600_13795, partial [Ignavibacteria bacterium]
YTYGSIDLGAFEYVPPVSVRTAPAPSALDISSVYPQPAEDHVTVELKLEQTSDITLRLYSLTGALVRESSDADLSGGAHQLRIDTRGLQSGLYLCTVGTNRGTSSRVVVVR